MAVSTAQEVTAALVDAIGRRDYEAIAGCFADEGRLRALVPQRLRDERGPHAVAERYRFWYGQLDGFELVESELEEVADRVRVRYRIRGALPEKGPVVQEQEGYATVEGGRVVALDVVCSGFRPAP